MAVTELLNRGALQSANTALNAVSDVSAKTSAINFLWGRLAWQSIKTGDKNYSLNDVRRSWETAVKDKPNSLEYHNALGFVYYIQGDLNRANQTWFQALYLVEEQAKTASFDVTKQNKLNAYAGLALVLSKLAENQPRDEQAKLLSEAIKLRQKVLTEEPINSQPQALSKSWLWTDKAIQDWQSLLKLKSG
jgi:tetratricopeptide (TPR) repeat protein